MKKTFTLFSLCFMSMSSLQGLAQSDSLKTTSLSINSAADTIKIGNMIIIKNQNEQSNYDKKNSNFLNEAKILFLSSRDHNYNLDYWLTFLERSISVIKDGQILTPIYADSTFEINEKTEKIDLNFFQYQKVIGSGGFSQVILGYCFFLF